jgi:tRNA(Arg) A34 adenosine deaminase TadA
MRNKIWNFLEIAGRTASKRSHDARDYWLGAAAVRSDGVIVTSSNGPAPDKTREVHAEYRLSKKLDYGATVYVARVRMVDGQFGLAKPCNACMNALKSRKVKKVYYTIGPSEYGTLILDKDEEECTNSNT